MTDGRELYVYYRVPAGQVEAALDEVATAQRTLIDRWPGLETRLLRRAEAPLTTCMEVYRHPGGLDDTLLDALRVALAPLPSARSGPRHEECFAPHGAGG